MKLNRRNFLSALDAAVVVADKTATPPILGNVLVTATLGAVEVIATDTRTTVSATVEATDPESFTVQAQELHAIVGGLDGDDLTIKVLEKKIELKCGGSKFTLGSMLVADFPAIPKFDASTAIDVNAAALARAIDGTSYAVSVDKPHLAGVFMETDGDELIAVSTDGQRMALQRVTTEWPSVNKLMVGSGAARSIASLIDGVESCSVSVDGEIVNVHSGNATLSSKLITSAFIPYQQFFAAKAWSKSPAVINRASMLAALKRMMLVKSTQKDRIMFGDVRVSPGKIELFREDQSTKAEETVACEGGQTMSVYCNLRFLADAIEHIVAESVELHVIGELDPINLRDGSGKQMAVVMPIRK